MYTCSLYYTIVHDSIISYYCPLLFFHCTSLVPIIQEIGFTDVSRFTLAVRIVLVSNGGRPILNCHVSFTAMIYLQGHVYSSSTPHPHIYTHTHIVLMAS